MRYRFGNGEFRLQPLDSLMEARREDDSLMVEDENGQWHIDVQRICGAFSFECLMQMLDSTDMARSEAERWVRVTRDEPIWGARNAVRHMLDCMGNREWAEKALLRLCEGP